MNDTATIQTGTEAAPDTAASAVLPEPRKKRVARTPDNILVALGFSPNRENRLKLKYWKSFPDWPKKQRHGFDIGQIKIFLDAHFEEFLLDGKRAKGIEQGDKFSGADLKLMQRGGGPRADEEPEVMGCEGMAGVLRAHFNVPVSKMDISDWGHGKRLDHGVPNFPPPAASGRFNKLAGIAWFAAHKFHDPRATMTPDLFKTLDTERATGELERLAHERLLRGVELKQYLKVTDHQRILAGLGKLGRDNLWELFDGRAYDRFGALLAECGMPPEWAAAAGARLRQLNVELLQQHHEFLQAQIEKAENRNLEKPAEQENLNL